MQFYGVYKDRSYSAFFIDKDKAERFLQDICPTTSDGGRIIVINTLDEIENSKPLDELIKKWGNRFAVIPENKGDGMQWRIIREIITDLKGLR